MDYIQQQLGVEWKKSCCMYCPYISKQSASIRYLEEPEDAGFALLTESIALALNPRMQLFSHGTAYNLVLSTGNTAAIQNYRERLQSIDWALYRVERIWEKKIGSQSGKPFTRVDRRVHQMESGTKPEMERALQKLAAQRQLTTEQNGQHQRVYSHRRNEAPLSCEGFWTICPALVKDKVRNAKAFEQKWQVASGELEQLSLFHSGSQTALE